MDFTRGISSASHILIKGAKVHNLKNIDVAIPHNKLIAISGVSGSGKSSLAIDTLYAEGQRRYVESLSAYARQFLMRMNKPEVDYIKGISPAIAIEQRSFGRSGRSTVGTTTEIYDFLRLFYAKAGITFSPTTGKVITQHNVQDVLNFVQELGQSVRIEVIIPLKNDDFLAETLESYLLKGFLRFSLGGKTQRIEDFLDEKQKVNEKAAIHLVIDRLQYDADDKELLNRLADAVDLAFKESEGFCFIRNGDKIERFSQILEENGVVFENPTAQYFNFNSPYGACPKCEGFGTIIGIDEDLVIPNRSLSIYEDAVVAWRGEKMSWWKNQLISNADVSGFPIHKPINELSEKHYNILWEGDGNILGLHAFFQDLEENAYKIQYRVMLSRYRGKTHCNVCKGKRLRPETEYVKIGGKPIGDLLLMSIGDLTKFFGQIELTPYQQEIGERILTEVQQRLKIMSDLGLDYLNLNRASNTLSGGESQRISLTRTLGSNLTGSMYILDEPSIGLHPHDTDRLITMLNRLRDLGNTVIVVEHEEEILKSADYLVDIGPEAGRFGGQVMYSGDLKKINKTNESLTLAYLNGTKKIKAPKVKRKPSNFIKIIGAAQYNLKNIDVKVPLNALTVVTGVSGSGKTTLIKGILYPAIRKHLGEGGKPGAFKSTEGALKMLNAVELVDQNPLGRSSRSNPVTYIKAYDVIRELFNKQSLSKIRAYKPKHFSFNVDGGRCDICKGDGEILVEMQFLADLHLPCETCGGKRFKDEILEVRYKDLNIDDVLNLSVEHAVEFFKDVPEVANKLKPLELVGLGYIKLGQSSNTLSGGEAQRVKLASFIAKSSKASSTLFIFDEPTTGLHFHDIQKLLAAFNALIEHGHSIVVIEHNMDVANAADWIIDLGPTGGENGGNLIYQGDVKGLLMNKKSLTAKALRRKM